MGSSDVQTVKAFVEAESYRGSSLIIAYSQCIAHGINMTTGFGQQKAAVACGAWPLYRYDPRLAQQGKNPLQLDSKDPSIPLEQYAYNEMRFKMLVKSNPEAAKRLLAKSQKSIEVRWNIYKQLAAMDYSQGPPAATG